MQIDKNIRFCIIFTYIMALCCAFGMVIDNERVVTLSCILGVIYSCTTMILLGIKEQSNGRPCN